MEWGEILKIKHWTPLADLPKFIDLGNRLHSIGPNAYLISLNHNSDFERDDPSAPFVGAFYWASSEAAIRRCIDGIPSPTEDAQDHMAPPEFLFGTDGKYESLLIKARHQPNSSNAYDVLNMNGDFLYHCLSIGRFEFLFFKEDPATGDYPFIVKIRPMRDQDETSEVRGRFFFER